MVLWWFSKKEELEQEDCESETMSPRTFRQMTARFHFRESNAKKNSGFVRKSMMETRRSLVQMGRNSVILAEPIQVQERPLRKLWDILISAKFRPTVTIIVMMGAAHFSVIVFTYNLCNA